jgi:hypothetical protein
MPRLSAWRWSRASAPARARQDNLVIPERRAAPNPESVWNAPETDSGFNRG